MSSTPKHYMGDGRITCADAMRSMTFGCGLPPMASYWWGCALKYLWRCPNKGGAEDIEKAIDCLQKLKEEAFGKKMDDEPPMTPEASEPCDKLVAKLEGELIAEDAIEAVEKDASDVPETYCKKRGLKGTYSGGTDNYRLVMTRDLLRRQREALERGK